MGPTPSIAAFSFDESAVVAPDKYRGALVWDATTGKIVSHIAQQQGRLLCAAFSPDGAKIITGGIDGSLKIWTLGRAADQGKLATLGTTRRLRRVGRFY